MRLKDMSQTQRDDLASIGCPAYTRDLLLECDSLEQVDALIEILACRIHQTRHVGPDMPASKEQRDWARAWGEHRAAHWL